MDSALITVRSQSSRLPNKCFLEFGEFSVIEHIIKRTLHYNLSPIVCTTNAKEDVEIVNICKSLGVKYFCGSSINKLQRWRDCCREYKIELFHTVDADDLFFCGEEVKRSLDLLRSGFDMVSPTPSASRGGCTVGFSLRSEIVEKACSEIPESTDTEMMWNFIKKVKDAKIITLNDPSDSIITERMTLDYLEDYNMLCKLRMIVGNLGTRHEIAKALKNHPELSKINFFRNEQWLNNQRKKSNEIN
tara:strand:- start:1624 stop:2361 length:738 start_codon:yes stop_codon:yes gene_type:complete